MECEEIRVFMPFRLWPIGQWVGHAVGVLLGAAALVGIGYTTWIGFWTLRWDIAVALLAMLPWWWLFGTTWWWLLKTIRRGGHPVVLLVSEHGMALGMNDARTMVRAFDGPKLIETEDELIIKNSAFYMVVKLPKDQISPEHADLIRRCVRQGPV